MRTPAAATAATSPLPPSSPRLSRRHYCRRSRIVAVAAAAIATASSALFATAPAVHAADFTWVGLGASNNWTDTANWNPIGSPNPAGGDGVTFGGQTRLTPFVTTTFSGAYNVRGLNFASGAGAFVIGGDHDLGIGVDGITQNASAGQTLTLASGNGVQLLASQTWTVNGGALTVNSPVEAQTNTLTKAGAGTLILGSNSVSGIVSHRFTQLDVNAGTLQVGDSARIVPPTGGAIQANIASGATLQFAPGAGNNWTFGGTLAGAGTFQKTGSGRVALGFASPSFTGDVLIDGGQLEIRSATSLANAKQVTVSNTGALVISAASATINNLNGVGSGANVDLGQVSSAVTMTAFNDVDTRYEGSLTGTGGLIKTGTGTLVLAGNNTYAGETKVQVGRLAVDGTLSGSGLVTVGNPLTALGGGEDAILGGKGTIGGDVLCAHGGFVSPGDSPGTLTLLSDLTIQSEGGMIIEMAGAQQGVSYDLLDVLGSVSLGGTLDLRFLGGFVPNPADTFDILRAGEGFVSGTFFDEVLINGETASASNYSLNLVTGSNGISTLRLSNVTGVAVPEPGSLALFVPGFGSAIVWLLMLQARRTRKKNEL